MNLSLTLVRHLGGLFLAAVMAGVAGAGVVQSAGDSNADTAKAQKPELTRSLMVPGGESGIEIHLLSTQGPSSAPNCRLPVLLLHPYGAPCAQAYDMPGFRLMQEIAATHRTVFAMDARGFGQSSKPLGSHPVGRAEDAVNDVLAAIDYIRRTTGAQKVELFGWSWGAVVAPMVAIRRPEVIERMALFGAMHAFVLPMMTQPFAAPDDPNRFGPSNVAYLKTETGKVLGHWRMMLQGRTDLVDDRTVRSVEDLAEQCSAGAPGASSGLTLRPMGPMQDLFEIWSDRPVYDASQVKTRTLVVRADLDLFADVGLVHKLPNAREVVIKDATHWLPYEKNRSILVRTLLDFFE